MIIIIIWTNAGILLIRPLGTNFSEILIEIHTFLFKKMHLKMPSAKWRPFCHRLNVLTVYVMASTLIHEPTSYVFNPYAPCSLKIFENKSFTVYNKQEKLIMILVISSWKTYLFPEKRT